MTMTISMELISDRMAFMQDAVSHLTILRGLFAGGAAREEFPQARELYRVLRRLRINADGSGFKGFAMMLVKLEALSLRLEAGDLDLTPRVMETFARSVCHLLEAIHGSQRGVIRWETDPGLYRCLDNLLSPHFGVDTIDMGWRAGNRA